MSTFAERAWVNNVPAKNEWQLMRNNEIVQNQQVLCDLVCNLKELGQAKTSDNVMLFCS